MEVVRQGSQQGRLCRLYHTGFLIVIAAMTEDGFPHPTPFEIETAVAFLFFKKENCDLVLLEVGMGGNLDATNIIKNTLLAVLVSISMDHRPFLEILWHRSQRRKPVSSKTAAEW